MRDDMLSKIPTTENYILQSCEAGIPCSPALAYLYRFCNSCSYVLLRRTKKKLAKIYASENV
jgi:uncharacterized protein YutD